MRPDYTASYFVAAIALVCIGAVGSLVSPGRNLSWRATRSVPAHAAPTLVPGTYPLVALLRERALILIQP